MKGQLPALERLIGIAFANKEILSQVFIHRSFLNENKATGLEHNERLEFLGDAVLELVVTEYLYRNYSNPEGDLTSYRSALVKGEMLSQVAMSLRLGEYLKLSKGEEKNQGRQNRLILANTFEALIGAIYLDQGYQKAKSFLTKFLLPHFQEVLDKKLFKDARSEFQELAQEKWGETPVYKVLSESGPDHNKQFEVGVYINKKLYGKGQDSSKQAACQKAAAQALSSNTL